jgi:hypothetical protein
LVSGYRLAILEDCLTADSEKAIVAVEISFVVRKFTSLVIKLTMNLVGEDSGLLTKTASWLTIKY